MATILLKVVSSETMESAIYKAIFDEAERMREDHIKSAVSEFEAMLREKVAVSSMKISSFYNIHREGHNLVITVKYS